MIIIIIDNLVPDVLFQKKAGKGIQVVLLTKLATKYPRSGGGCILNCLIISVQDGSVEMNY